MGIPSTSSGGLEDDLQTRPCTDGPPRHAGDVEWVADLLDTFHTGDLDAVADALTQLTRTIREAAKARRMLATVDPALLRRARAVCDARAEAAR